MGDLTLISADGLSRENAMTALVSIGPGFRRVKVVPVHQDLRVKGEQVRKKRAPSTLLCEEGKILGPRGERAKVLKLPQRFFEVSFHAVCHNAMGRVRAVRIRVDHDARYAPGHFSSKRPLFKSFS
jgi:hypothetical protein